MCQVCQALAYLHAAGLAHLDVKSENILLNLTGQVRLADFGLVREADPAHPNLVGMVGTSYWMAPEILRRQPYNQKVDVRPSPPFLRAVFLDLTQGRTVQIWALGCVCMELAQGAPPYHSRGSLAAMFLTATRGAPPVEHHEQRGTTSLRFSGERRAAPFWYLSQLLLQRIRQFQEDFGRATQCDGHRKCWTSCACLSTLIRRGDQRLRSCWSIPS